MKCKEELEEEVDFWLGYISKWEASHNEPVPDRALQLLNNALIKLESHCPSTYQALLSQGNNHTIH